MLLVEVPKRAGVVHEATLSWGFKTQGRPPSFRPKDITGDDSKLGSKKRVAKRRCHNSAHHVLHWDRSETQIETAARSVKRNRPKEPS
jgi:hypothetical protein